MKELYTLNFFQLNIYQILLFMHKVKNNSVPRVFNQTFSINNNKNNTRSTKTSSPKLLLKAKLQNILQNMEIYHIEAHNGGIK